MRTAFIDALSALADEDPSVVLITGDLGFGVFDDFRARHADQFINMGVAEQNMAGVAAGLALTGHTVFTYSIGNFPTLRALEQVRNDVCYHRANVKIVTVGGGLAYGALGPSHFATEDIAILRALPEMTVVAPGDPVEVSQLVPQIAHHAGPVYLRLGRAGEPTVHEPDAEIKLGEPAVARTGSDVLLLTTGGMLQVAMEAADLLHRGGIEAQVVSVHTVKPLAGRAIVDMANRFAAVITCEEHVPNGGLGSAVSEVLLEAGTRVGFARFALPAGFPTGVGSQEHMRSINGIDATALVSRARDLLQ